MRYSVLVLGLVLACGTSASAQQNQQPQRYQAPAAQLESNPRLDQLLAQWEARMTGVKSLEARISREYTDSSFKTKELYVGSAHYQSPNLARLDLSRQDNPSIFERIVCTGQFTYQFVPAQKQVRVYEMGPTKNGQISEDNFLSFLIGMKAADAKSRYILKLVKEDVNYIYIEVKPRNPADLADFSLAQLALTQGKLLPRQLIYTEANGNVATWNMDVRPDVALDRRLFQQPQTPQGWELKKMPRLGAKPDGNAGVPPRIVRPQGPG